MVHSFVYYSLVLVVLLDYLSDTHDLYAVAHVFFQNIFAKIYQ